MCERGGGQEKEDALSFSPTLTLLSLDLTSPHSPSLSFSLTPLSLLPLSSSSSSNAASSQSSSPSKKEAGSNPRSVEEPGV